MTGALPGWLRGRFQPIDDDLDWDALAAGLDLPGSFASVVALADEIIAAADPWGDRAQAPLRLTAEQRDHLA